MGAVRLMLAFGVLLEHTGAQIMPAADAVPDYRLTMGIYGGYSVLWFYVISGFLMSTVLHEKYSNDIAGNLAFYKSRFLRIFPLWWVVFIFCSVFVLNKDGHAWINISSTRDYLWGLALYGMDWRLIFSSYPDRAWEIFPIGSDVGWTLSAEITFYLIAPFVLRSLKWSITLFALSLAIRIMVIAFIDNATLHITWNYFFFPSTLCFFLLGHMGRMINLKLKVPTSVGLFILALSFALSFQIPLSPRSFDNPLVYSSIVLFGLALPALFSTTKDNKISNFFGDLTYPLYLIGNLCLNAILAVWSGVGDYGMWIIHTARVFDDAHSRGLFIIAMVLFFVFPAAVIVHYFIERPAIFVVRFALNAAGRGRAAWSAARSVVKT